MRSTFLKELWQLERLDSALSGQSASRDSFPVTSSPRLHAGESAALQSLQLTSPHHQQAAIWTKREPWQNLSCVSTQATL